VNLSSSRRYPEGNKMNKSEGVSEGDTIRPVHRLGTSMVRAEKVLIRGAPDQEKRRTKGREYWPPSRANVTNAFLTGAKRDGGMKGDVVFAGERGGKKRKGGGRVQFIHSFCWGSRQIRGRGYAGRKKITE